ncbi:MAG: hypothetical protein QG607_101 [Patescibacteria group bacterium]|jgi:hypothetical protein|nr:hypothetical protein [Patescibacteria group bacterium]
MFSIPLYFILVLYFIFLAIFFVFSAANVYHVYSTGTFTIPSLTITTLVSAFCVFVLFITFTNLIAINWSTSILFFGPAGVISFQ